MNKSSRNSFVLDLDMGRRRLGLGRPRSLASPSVEARRLGAKHSGDFILKVQANGIISSLISIYQINHYWMLNPSVKLNFQNWTSF